MNVYIINTKYQEFIKNQATMTDAVRQMKEKELNELASRRDEFIQMAQQDQQKEQTRLYTPIYQKAQNAVDQIAKAGGYTVIFQTGQQPYLDEAAVTDILAEVQRQHLPYTVIDVGWWTQQILFRLPSGRTNHGAFEIFQFIPGEGDVPVAITDIRDIGRYVAEIITDPRTLNKSVFAYTEVMTLNEMVKLQERISGEKTGRMALQYQPRRILRRRYESFFTKL